MRRGVGGLRTGAALVTWIGEVFFHVSNLSLNSTPISFGLLAANYRRVYALLLRVRPVLNNLTGLLLATFVCTYYLVVGYLHSTTM